MPIELTLQKLSRHALIPTDAEFKHWIKMVLKYSQCRQAEINLRIINRAESARLNYTYRQKLSATNVLAFLYTAKPLHGDIVLCAPLISEQAKQQDKSAIAHWAHLVMHGALHLLGYDHLNASEAEQMEQRERQLLAQLNITDPYAEQA